MTIDKDEIRAIVTDIMAEWHANLTDPDKGPLSHYCLFWADATVKVLNRFGLKAQLNAGSSQWRVCEDDGVNPDHFGYAFEWNRESQLQFMTGHMPEMHVWAAVHPNDCPEGRGQIIDFTTRFQTARAREFGVTVDRELPDYLWFYLDRIFPSSIYTPHPAACHLAHIMLTQSEGV